MLIELFFAVALFLLVLQWFNGNVFARLNIPGPKGMYFFGNLFDTFGRKVVPLQLQKWTKEYGSIYGFYQGNVPVLVVSDPDFVQELLVKKFNYFHGRKEFSIQPNPETGGDRVHMFLARGAKWKRLRVISNPAFTSAKIKQTLPYVHECVGELLQVLEGKRKEDTAFDIYSVYQGLTLDVIARVAFAYDISVQKGDNDFLKLTTTLSRTPPSFLSFVAYQNERITEEWKPACRNISVTFPSMRRLIYYLLRCQSYVIGSDLDKARERTAKMIELRREQKTAKVDFIQLLLDAEADPKDVGGLDLRNASLKSMDVKKKLTPGEIASQGFLFLFAGFETTSAALAFVTYLLSTHPAVQDKLRAEIDAHIETDEDITYETVKTLQYLDSVIQETLRLYPVASGAVTRQCAESCTIDGVYIPKDMNVQVDVWSLHHSETLWGADADEFKPERFMSKSARHPFAFLPFGAGPRLCIGMRFALLEIKIALCYILKRYVIMDCAQTEKPLQIRYNFSVTVTPKNGVYVQLKERSDGNK